MLKNGDRQKPFAVFNQKELSKEPSSIFTTYFGLNNQRWVVSPTAVYYFDSATNKYAFFHPVIFPANTHQTSFVATGSNTTWVAANSQLYLFDKKNQKVWSDNYNPTSHPLLQESWQGTGKKFLRFLMIDSRQNIWVTTWGDALYKYVITIHKRSAAIRYQPSKQRKTIIMHQWTIL
jgi:hypothetical protein